MNSKFSVSLKNVRAIHKAKIELNGITVLAGENGCGKTTVSKMLYGFVKTSLDFDKILNGETVFGINLSNMLYRVKNFEYNATYRLIDVMQN